METQDTVLKSSVCRACGASFEYTTPSGQRGPRRGYCDPCGGLDGNGTIRKRIRHLRHLYRVELPEYNEMLLAANGICSCCSEPVGNKLVLDHRHGDGRARGFVCHPCNFALGWLRDDPNRADGVAAYLRRHSSTS